jgi:hypothetical protein
VTLHEDALQHDCRGGRCNPAQDDDRGDAQQQGCRESDKQSASQLLQAFPAPRRRPGLAAFLAPRACQRLAAFLVFHPYLEFSLYPGAQFKLLRGIIPVFSRDNPDSSRVPDVCPVVPGAVFMQSACE